MISKLLPLMRSWIDEAFLSEQTSFGWHPSLTNSARHVLLGKGKALRPACLVWSHNLLTGASPTQRPSRAALQWGLALEMVHTYSLVHDDLPAMDDDSFRRGSPTLHVLKSQAEAILAGDALLTGAFELVARAEKISDRTTTLAILELARASGGAGMVSGQLRDMMAERTDVASGTTEQLQTIHNEKTGALFGCAFALGALATGDARLEAKINEIRQWGVDLGLLFQITDDILDVTATQVELGKSAGKDAQAAKLTYVSLLGTDGAKAKARELAEALNVNGIKLYSNDVAVRDLVQFVLDRRN